MQALAMHILTDCAEPDYPITVLTRGNWRCRSWVMAAIPVEDDSALLARDSKAIIRLNPCFTYVPLILHVSQIQLA
jgi:hypothetical protein